MKTRAILVIDPAGVPWDRTLRVTMPWQEFGGWEEFGGGFELVEARLEGGLLLAKLTGGDCPAVPPGEAVPRFPATLEAGHYPALPDTPLAAKIREAFVRLTTSRAGT